MRKSQLTNLVAGSKVMDKRNNDVLEVVAMQDGKYILNNGKVYSQSTMYRWFAVEEVEQPVEEKTVEEKVVEDKPVEPIKPTITVEKTVDDENHEDHTSEANSNVLAGENTIEQIIQKYNCHTQKMQQYTAVKSDNTKKTLVYIRVAKEGGYHFDISQKTWHKLNKAYANWLTTNFNAGIKDKTRKLYRVSCNDLKIFKNLLKVALS